jgi:tetratricopeptide (TPR) repeat protein
MCTTRSRSSVAGILVVLSLCSIAARPDHDVAAFRGSRATVLQNTPADRPSRDWKRLTTPSLTVVGTAQDGDLRRVGLEIERFRAALRSMIPTLKLDAPTPTLAVVFRDDAAFRPFKPRARGKIMDNVAGYFMSRPHVNYMVMAPSGDREFTSRVIFHEYTHHLVNLNFTRLPLWLNEGLAEFYSTFSGSDRDARTIIGRPIDGHVATLLRFTPIPLATFVRAETPGELYRDVARTPLLYAQSWGLVHFLLVGNNGAHRARLGRFVAAVERGAAADTTFVEIFGPDLSALDRELYAHVSKFRLDALQLQPDAVQSSLAISRLPELEAQHLQGDLLVQTGASELAERHLSAALALDPASIPAQVSMAMLRLQQERFADALERLSAPALDGSPNPAVHFVRAEALRWSDRHQDAAAAYRRAIALQPASAHPHFGLSLSQLAIGDKAGAAESFARCTTLSPTPEWFRGRVMAVMRLGLADFVVSDARTYIERVGWSDDGVYVMLPAVIVMLRGAQKEAARGALADIEKQVKPNSWQASLVAFFRGELAGDTLIVKAGRDDGLLTEAHAYVGILDSIAGNRDKALKHLEWVKNSGRKDFIEYGFALGELRRLQRSAP